MNKYLVVAACIAGFSVSAYADEQDFKRTQSFTDFADYVEQNLENIVETRSRIDVRFTCYREGLSNRQWRDIISRVAQIIAIYTYDEDSSEEMMHELIDTIKEARNTECGITFGEE